MKNNRGLYGNSLVAVDEKYRLTQNIAYGQSVRVRLGTTRQPVIKSGPEVPIELALFSVSPIIKMIGLVIVTYRQISQLAVMVFLLSFIQFVALNSISEIEY